MAFKSSGTQKDFQKRITQQSIVEEDLSHDQWGKVSFLGKQFFSGRQKAEDYVKMLNDLSLTQERRLCGIEWIFQQDNAVTHNASITKKY